MTTFKEIRGTAIQSVSSDPTNPEVGQIWYNNTIGVLKGYRSIGGAWASGGNLNTAISFLGGCGTQTAGLGFGGYATSVATEEYNGSTWSPGGNLNTGRRLLAGAGTQTAGLAFGGGPPNSNSTEEYDGSTWGPGGNLGTARRGLAGAGTQTLALAFGGGNPGGVLGATESWNGTNWTTTTSMATARGGSLAGAGIQTATFAAGGATPTYSNLTEEFTGAFLSNKNVTIS